MAEWDPFAIPILTEVGGIVKFGDMVEGVTVTEKVDEVTGLSRKIVIESRAADLRPRITIADPETGEAMKLPGTELDARYLLPVGANIVAQEGEMIDPGEVIAKIPRDTTKTQDITGGLPRVAELFEARKPKDHAIISEIDGEVSFGKDTKGKRKVIITPFAADGSSAPGSGARVPDPEGQAHPGAAGRSRPRGRAAEGRPGEPARHPRVKGEKELAGVPRERNPAGLPPAGRRHQRQAHRGHRAADAASRARQGRG